MRLHSTIFLTFKSVFIIQKPTCLIIPVRSSLQSMMGQLLNGNVYRQHGSAAVSSSVDLFSNADDNYFQIYCQQITAQDTVPHLHGKSINIIFVAITCFTSGLCNFNCMPSNVA
jgi:hypothetical protein